MRTKSYSLIFIALLLTFEVTLCGEPAAPLASLEPALQQALERDAVCSQKSPSLEMPVAVQEILVGGRDAGVIASPQDQCYCQKENCSTFVYLKNGQDYRLAMTDTLASLHPMKVAKHGLPSLSGKFQVNELREETTIFDWDGAKYEPSLCATVTRHPNQRVPSIMKHQCRSAARSFPQP